MTGNRAPAQIDITLEPASIVEGQLIDDVTGEPLADHVVSAQGVHSSDWFQTKTDKEGRYRLALTRDLFNLSSTSEDRIAVACANVDATPEQITSGVDIHMLAGGFVVGSVVDPQTGKTFFTRQRST